MPTDQPASSQPRAEPGTGDRTEHRGDPGDRRRLIVRLTLATLLVVLCAGSVWAQQADAAQAPDEVIRSYDVTIDVRSTGRLRVTEAISYDFGANQRRGIFRFIPRLVRADDQHDRVYGIENLQVDVQARSGDLDPRARQVDLYDDGDFRVAQVGEANTFITGEHLYTFSYDVRGAIETVERPDQAWEELVWNAIGTGWGVRIASATITVNQPEAPLSSECFLGARGSTRRCEAASEAGLGEVRSIRQLNPNEAVTVRATYPVGTFDEATAELERRVTLATAFEATPTTLPLAGLVSLIGGVGLFRSLSSRARDRRLVLNAYLPADHQPDTDDLVGFFEKPDGPVQFRPPAGVPPGLLGTLLDESADPLDVSASIVDLAVRGYLKIEEYGEERFRIHRLRLADADLLPYETMLMDKLFQHSSRSGVVTLDDLEEKFAEDLKTIRNALYDETMERDWFTRRPDQVRAAWLTGGIFATVVAGGLTFGLARLFFGLVGLPLIFCGLAIAASAKFMPARTGTGRQMLEHVVGYERFLEVADADMLKFHDAQNQFVEALPYAMVFGLTHKWASVLEQLAQEGFDLQPNWYVGSGYRSFSYYHFGNSMSSFSTRSTRSMVSVPAKTNEGGGFGGGGGFAGGGGGGGGGGSW